MSTPSLPPVTASRRPAPLDAMRARAEEARFGFWIFLMSDLVIFSLFFATYAIMWGNRADGPGPEDLFQLKSAAIQTGCLLLSSVTFGLVTLNAHRQVSVVRTMIWLVITLALGAGFLGFEISDFIDMVQQEAGISASGFLSSFYALVGTHGLHVTVGCLWILIMLLQIGRFGLTPPVVSRIMRLGLFWHFLDIIWIGIFSIVYLIGLAK